MERLREAVLKGKGRLFLLILLTALLSATAAGNVFAAPFAYITNFHSNNVSVIDTSTNTVVATIPVGVYPYGVAVNPSGSRVYVANLWSNTVSVIDTSTNTVVDTIAAGGGLAGVAVNPSGTRVYVVNFSDHIVAVMVIDTSTNTVVDTIPVGVYPYGVAVNPSGTRVYVTNFYGNNVSVIDTSTNTVVATIPVGSHPYGVAVNPSGSRVYVANRSSHTVSVIDTSTNTVVDTIAVGGAPQGVAVNPSGSRVYVANINSNNVSVIDTSTNTVVATVSVGSLPHGVAVNPSGSRVYVANSGSNNVSVIDTSTNTVVDTIAVGTSPSPMGKFIGPGECAQPPANLFSWWSGDNNANDSIGTNHGTLMNGATFAAGMVGQAFSFDGVDDYVQNVAPIGLPVGNAPRSIDLWFRTPLNLAVHMNRMLVQYGSPANGQMFALVTSSNCPEKLIFYGHDADLCGTTTILPDTWYHAAVTYDGTTLSLYLNGNLESQETKSLNTVMEANGLTIGNMVGWPLWQGLIDEVEIFNRALTHEEINAIYNAGSAGKCRPCATPPSNMVSWWRGQDNANDIIGTNHGTMMNGATFAAGKVGQAFSFDGVNDYVTVPDSNQFNIGAGDFSLSLWANYSAVRSGSQGLLPNVFLGQDEAGGTNNKWVFYSTDSGLWFHINGSVSRFVGPAAFTPQTGRWYQFTLTRSGSVYAYYVDGLKIGEVTDSTTIPNVSAPLMIAQAEGLGYFNGLMDEITVFNRALTADEIAAIYNAGSAGKCIQQQQQHTLTVTKAGTGTGTVTSSPVGIDCGGDCSEAYNNGTAVTLTATANAGSTFTGWSTGTGSASGCTGTGDCIFNITANSGVTATFTLNTYTVTANAAGNGTGNVASSTGGINYGYPAANTGTTTALNHGTNVVLTATAGAGSTVSWTTCTGAAAGNGTTSATCTFTSLDGNKTAAATFTLNQYTVTPSAGTGGSISPNTPQTVNHGATTTFTVTPDTGYSINTVTGCGGSLLGTTFTTGEITGACTVVANFTLNRYTVTPSAGPNGSITPNTPQMVNHGATTTFTVTPDTGYAASVGTTCGGSLVGTTYTTGAITANCTVTATFTYITFLPGLTSDGRIFYTTNLQTWTNLSGVLSQLVVGDFNGDDRSDLAGLTSDGQIFYTTDLQTWTNFPGVLSQLVVGDFDGNGSSDLAGLASNGTIWVTTDLLTWTQILGFLSDLVAGDFDGDGSSDLAGLASNGTIWVTTNLLTWTQIPGFLSQLVAGDFNGDGSSDLAGLTSNGLIFYTTNLSTWTHIPGVLDQLVVGDFDGNGSSDLAGLTSTGLIFYTTDLQTWTNIPGALNQLVVGGFNEDVISDLAGLTSTGLIFYTTNRSTWTQIPGVLADLAK